MFEKINKNIIGILDNSVNSVKMSDFRIGNFGSIFDDLRRTFEEITKASIQIAEIAEIAGQLSCLNKELADKFKGG
ncbi:hypothetical protein [Peribacillus saganii]|uniref:hypothetical protein n=1 Tax=Peribacillus saganii TaxID=2303992 RepID=UPI0013144EA5|nr:hypothetical protein [Peribacillus saganii]